MGRVNQKMIDQMIAMRHQGFTHADVGRRLGVSERTVRRHTSGVSPELVHAGDPSRVDLLQWCMQCVFAWKDRLDLDVEDLNIAAKHVRKAIDKLDELVAAKLEVDKKLRLDFLFSQVLPRAMRDIKFEQDLRRIEAEIGPLDRTGADPED